MLYVLAGRILSALAEPPTALSALSACSGLISVALLIFVVRWLPARLAQPPTSEPAPLLASASAAAAYALTPLFVEQASIQEVYAMQAALLLGSAAILVAPTVRRPALAGVVFGCALGTHNGSALVAPALAYLAWSTGGGRRSRALATWAGAAAATFGVVALGIALILPVDPAGARLVQVLSYLRGAADPFRWETLATFGPLAHSLAGLAMRLFTLSLVPPWIEVEAALRADPFLVGAGVVRVTAVLIGVVALARRSPRETTFWILWPVPFLLYELLLRETVDPGAYLPFVLPALAVWVASSVEAVARSGRPTRSLASALALAWLALLVAPGVVSLAANWHEPDNTRAAHFTREVLAAVWMADNLPADAVVVGPRLPLNPNVVPYYSRRRPIILPDRLPVLLRDPRPFTPLRLASFEPVTTERLAHLMDAGIAVFALEDRPIARQGGPAPFDPDAFRWLPTLRVDVRAVAAALDLPEAIRAALECEPVILYRGERALPRSGGQGRI